MKKLTLMLVAVLVLLVGCATNGIDITKSNNQIDMPHYSITVPPDHGWSLRVEDNRKSIIWLTKKIDSTAFSVRLGINWIAGEHMKSWSAKQVADDYRNGERADMLMRGVMTGQYRQKDVVMGEEVVGDKQFYTMSYVNMLSDMTQYSSLYLYFPKETDIGVFIVVLYTEGVVGRGPRSDLHKPEFISVLESLQVNRGALME